MADSACVLRSDGRRGRTGGEQALHPHFREHLGGQLPFDVEDVFEAESLEVHQAPQRESACETCACFRTGTQFLPILTRQRDHARDHGQAERAVLFDGLIQRAGAGPATTGRS